MAIRKWGARIDFESHQSLNFVLDNVTTANMAAYLTVEGKLAYDVTAKKIKTWDGTAIQTLAYLTDIANLAVNLSELDDVSITAVADNNVLVYESTDSKWHNVAVSGDLTNSAGSFTVNKLQNKTLTMAGAATAFGFTVPTTNAVYTFPAFATATLASLNNIETFSASKTFSGGIVISSAVTGTFLKTTGTGWGTPLDTELASAKLIYDYINAQIATGVSYRPPVDLVYNVPATALGPTSNTIDGVTVTAGMRVLVVDSLTAGQDHMIMLASGAAGAWVWTIQQDGTGSDLPQDGHTVWVKSGTTEADTRWTFNGTTWVQISGAGTYTADTGISLVGNTFKHVINSDSYAHVQTGGAANQVLTYSAINGTGQKGTWGLLVNANIAASGTANIDWNKLVAKTPNYAVVTDASGFPTVEQYLNVTRGGTGVGTLTQYGILYGDGTATIKATTAAGGGGKFIQSTATAPTWSGYTLPVSIAAGDIFYATGTGAMASLTKGTANQILGMNAAASAPEYKAVNGVANRIGIAHAANSITISLDTTQFPQAVLADVGKFFKATAANTAVWSFLSLADLPNTPTVGGTTVSIYYRMELVSSASTVSVTGATHGCGLFPEVRLYRKDGADSYSIYDVEVLIGASGNLTINSESAWPANSYLVIIGR